MVEFNLEEAGLSKNQAKVYESLVKHGVLSSVEVSSKSGVHYGRIYDVLGSLIEKGLVAIIPGKNKRFAATSPENLIKIIEDKELLLKTTKERISEFKKMYETREAEAIKVSFGDRGFWQLASEIPPAKEYGYNIRWNSTIRPNTIHSIKEDLKKKINVKHLARYDAETKKDVLIRKKYRDNIKKLDNEGIALCVQDDELVFIGLIKSNTTLFIRDKPFAKIMKKMFEETYKNAEEIKN